MVTIQEQAMKNIARGNVDLHKMESYQECRNSFDVFSEVMRYKEDLVIFLPKSCLEIINDEALRSVIRLHHPMVIADHRGIDAVRTCDIQDLAFFPYIIQSVNFTA